MRLIIMYVHSLPAMEAPLDLCAWFQIVNPYPEDDSMLAASMVISFGPLIVN